MLHADQERREATLAAIGVIARGIAKTHECDDREVRFIALGLAGKRTSI